MLLVLHLRLSVFPVLPRFKADKIMYRRFLWSASVTAGEEVFGISKLFVATIDVSPVVALLLILWEAERSHFLGVTTEVFKQ